jgi:hypothetical protein
VGARADHERHGLGCSRHRRADPRIAARIHAALGEAGTVLNETFEGGLRLLISEPG